jgi:hypothetical protein
MREFLRKCCGEKPFVATKPSTGISCRFYCGNFVTHSGMLDYRTVNAWNWIAKGEKK